MSLKGKTDIFDSPSQLMDHDPRSIRLLGDRCLIRDLGLPEKDGSLWIPEAHRESEWGTLRIGEIMATGPGDSFIELGYDDLTGVRRKLITVLCPLCRGNKGTAVWRDPHEMDWYICQGCIGEGRLPITVPPQCSAGDKVLYSRRREAELVLNGELLSVVNAEQSVIAVLED